VSVGTSQRVLVTGSSDGIGLQAAADLVAAGHQVTLHARSEPRAAEAVKQLGTDVEVLIGDLSSLAETKALAEAADRSGRFDAVIHNAGVGESSRRHQTADGLELIFQVNVLAPYVLTALMTRPDRLIYLSSGMHLQGRAHLDDLQWERRRWHGTQAYADSKLYDVMLALAASRRWPDVAANAVDPGWVRTKMGGRGAPLPLAQGADTAVWLAVGDDAEARAGGRYLYQRSARPANPEAYDESLQERLLAECARLSGVSLPE
jgi:NAD(P)-dependent dehydrogenase (short-subunit alcohol dehydrogenase family)